MIFTEQITKTIIDLPMTLIVCLKNEDGFILAGDKRAIYEDNLHSYKDNQKKVFRLNKKVAVAGVGDGDDAVPAINKINQLDNSTKDVTQIAEEIRGILANDQLQWNTPVNQKLAALHRLKIPSYGFIVAGYTHNLEQKTYTINSSDVRLRDRNDNYLCEGITDIAKGHFASDYSADMTLDELVALAELAIKETSKISYGVSGTFDLIKITP